LSFLETGIYKINKRHYVHLFFFKGVFGLKNSVKKTKSGNSCLLKNILSGCIVLLSGFIPGFAGNYTGANPTLAQIDANWRALYGSPVHEAIVVYNKMGGGNDTATDKSKDSVCIMRFGMQGSTAATIKNLIKYAQWGGVGGWGVSSAYRISPDGSKIAMANNSNIQVCDTTGLNVKQIKSVNLQIDQLALSWDDSASIRRIVYSIGFIIVRTVINSDNSAGKTDTLWNHSYGKDPSGGSVYTSVNKVGHYLSFDIPAGANLPCIVDLYTQTLKNPTNGGDGCQARMLQDALGTFSYHEKTHLKAATVWRWSTNGTIASIPCPTTSNCSDCGNNMFYWCDSDTNFMIQTGDNDASGSPGCYTKAFIRKGKTSANVMYLGDYFAFPALWINPVVGTKTIRNRDVKTEAKVSIKLMGRELTLVSAGNASIDNAVLTNVNGAVVARGGKISTGRELFSVSSLRAGMYLLSWHQGNGTLSRYITITR
jgi:hypothetical protein